MSEIWEIVVPSAAPKYRMFWPVFSGLGTPFFNPAPNFERKGFHSLNSFPLTYKSLSP